MIRDPGVLECQDCGRVIRHLSVVEAQRIAVNPYNFVFWCDDCSRKRITFRFD